MVRFVIVRFVLCAKHRDWYASLDGKCPNGLQCPATRIDSELDFPRTALIASAALIYAERELGLTPLQALQ